MRGTVLLELLPPCPSSSCPKGKKSPAWSLKTASAGMAMDAELNTQGI